MTRSLIARARNVARIQGEGLHWRWSVRWERFAFRTSEQLYRAADWFAAVPFANERSPLPSSKTIEELVEFTGIAQPIVEETLRTRAPVNFRGEWIATDPRVRMDRWFYLSAKGYLFGNATHFPDERFSDELVLPYVPAGGSVLDFGAGTGELALQLAGHGLRVTVSELNALQRDFIRFRVSRRGLERQIDVVDPWIALGSDRFDAIVAADVLEHLPDAARVLGEELLPALREGGVIIENSPFLVSTANPMHHEDFGLVPFLESRGFRLVAGEKEGTRVWRGSQTHERTATVGR